MNAFVHFKVKVYSQSENKLSELKHSLLELSGPHNFFAHNRSMHHEMQLMMLSCFYCPVRHQREYHLSQHMATDHFKHLKFR